MNSPGGPWSESPALQTGSIMGVIKRFRDEVLLGELQYYIAEAVLTGVEQAVFRTVWVVGSGSCANVELLTFVDKCSFSPDDID